MTTEPKPAKKSEKSVKEQAQAAVAWNPCPALPPEKMLKVRAQYIREALARQQQADELIAQHLRDAKTKEFAGDVDRWLAWCSREFGWGRSTAFARLDPKQMAAHRENERERQEEVRNLRTKALREQFNTGGDYRAKAPAARVQIEAPKPERLAEVAAGTASASVVIEEPKPEVVLKSAPEAEARAIEVARNSALGAIRAGVRDLLSPQRGKGRRLIDLLTDEQRAEVVSLIGQLSAVMAEPAEAPAP